MLLVPLSANLLELLILEIESGRLVEPFLLHDASITKETRDRSLMTDLTVSTELSGTG